MKYSWMLTMLSCVSCWTTSISVMISWNVSAAFLYSSFSPPSSSPSSSSSEDDDDEEESGCGLPTRMILIATSSPSSLRTARRTTAYPPVPSATLPSML